jgi:hypothetical protein
MKKKTISGTMTREEVATRLHELAIRMLARDSDVAGFDVTLEPLPPERFRLVIYYRRGGSSHLSASVDKT